MDCKHEQWTCQRIYVWQKLSSHIVKEESRWSLNQTSNHFVSQRIGEKTKYSSMNSLENHKIITENVNYNIVTGYVSYDQETTEEQANLR